MPTIENLQNIEKLVRTRRSFRTYDTKNLSEQDREKLCDFFSHATNPYGLPVWFKLLENMSSPVVVGTDLFVGAKMKYSPEANVAFGYSFEAMVLYAMSLGIGTVWIGGTMDRGVFEKGMELADDEFMPCVSPIGYPAAKMSFREGMMRKAVKADSRLDFDKIVYRDSFDNPMKYDDAGKLALPLELVRLAPSAVNKQPWRMVVTDQAVHFYILRSKNFKPDKLDMQMVDMGIALCHFDLAAKELGISCEFAVSDPNIATTNGEEYVASYNYKI